MTCIVCHRSIGTRAKKCSVCGAPTALGKGNFIFEMDTADKNQLKKYYEQGQAQEAEMNAAAPEVSTNNQSQATSAQTASTKENADSAYIGTTTHRGPIAEFIWLNDLSLLKGCAWASLVFGFVGLMWRPAVFAFIVLLAFSVYIMLKERYYSYEPVFWICGGVALLTAIACGIWGYLDFGFNPLRMSEIINANVEAAEKVGVDPAIQLNSTLDFLFSGCALAAGLALLPLNMALVWHENKETTGSRVLMFAGYILFLLILGFGMHTLGRFICANDVITDYIANLAG